MNPLNAAVEAIKLATAVLDKDQELQDLYTLQQTADTDCPQCVNNIAHYHDDDLPKPQPVSQPAREILNEYLQERGRRNRRDIMIKCPACKGRGREFGYFDSRTECPDCGGKGKIVKPQIEQKLRPWAERLEKALYDEFMQWWPTSNAAKTRSPETVKTKWADHPTQPVTHWLNVEDFLKERYPEAATGSQYGGEGAGPLMERSVRADDIGYDPNTYANPTPEWLEAHGYIGTGNAITQAFLNLHNQYNRRPWRSKEDKRRTYEMLLRHIGPGAAKQPKAAANTTRQVPISPAAITDDIVYGLSRQFDEWAKAVGATNPYDDRLLENGASRANSWVRGPIGYWPNIENFLKENYPAAHRGLEYGFEDVQPLLDGEGEDADLPHLNGTTPYESGPDAVAKHGYDPREVVSTLLLLHNDTHPGRSNYLKKDQQRLLDIAQKRFQMQREYEERQKIASFDPRQVTERISEEFREWADQNRDSLHPTDPYPPERDWKNIELFLKDRYPEAHKGFSMGREQAQTVLDITGKCGLCKGTGKFPVGVLPENQARCPGCFGKRYKTGPKTLEALGYDPKEIAAGALYLHNQSHPFRMEWGNDLDRLTKIFQRRQQMQKAYEERQALADAKTALRMAQQILAMPAPPPQGLHFKYHATNDSIPPEYSGVRQGGSHTFLAPAVAAYVGDEPVGYVEWWPTDRYPNAKQHYRHTMDKGKPGEVYYIYVRPDLRRHSIATAMFDWAKQNAEPDLHHSPKRSELGKQWIGYEENRELQRAAQVLTLARRVLSMPMEDAYDPGAEYEDYYAPPEDPKPISPSKNGKWYHISPHVIQPGTRLVPGGGETVFNYRRRIPRDRQKWVWMTSREEADDWLDILQSVTGKPLHAYEVTPEIEGPWPWNGTGNQGYASPAATVVREIPIETGETDCRNCVGRGCGFCKNTGKETRQRRILWEDQDANPPEPMPKYAPTFEDLERAASAIRQAQHILAMPVPRGTDPQFTPHQRGPHGDVYFGDGEWMSDKNYPEPTTRAPRRMEPDESDRAKWEQVYKQRPYLLQSALAAIRQAQQVLAMPAVDAYDKHVPRKKRITEHDYIPSGPWYHGTDYELEDGTVLIPGGGASKYKDTLYKHPDMRERMKWVWLAPGPNLAHRWGQHVYEVEPLDEGPWPWNGDGDSFTEFVVPRARIIRKLDPATAAGVFASKQVLAMPAPAPKGLRFEYNPNFVHPSADYLGRVEAYIDDHPVGHIEWLKKNNPLSVVTDRKPGEVSFVFVHPNYRRHSIATEMFDWTKKNVAPDLHHSERRTDLGEKWIGYEQGRVDDALAKAAAVLKFAEPMADAYDNNWPNNHDVPERKRDTIQKLPDDISIYPGPWYHGTGNGKLKPGDILVPGFRKRNLSDGVKNRTEWTWMSDHPIRARGHGRYVYVVEPLDEGPYPWNGRPGIVRGHYVSPRARIIRRLTDKEMDEILRKDSQNEFVSPGEEFYQDIMKEAAAVLKFAMPLAEDGTPVPEKLYRGIGLVKGELAPEIEQRLDAALAGNPDPELADLLLNHFDRYGDGIGEYWAVEPRSSEHYTKTVRRLNADGEEQSSSPADYQVMLEADWDGHNGHPDYDVPVSSWQHIPWMWKRQLLPGAPVKMRSVRVRRRSPEDSNRDAFDENGNLRTDDDWVELGGGSLDRYAAREDHGELAWLYDQMKDLQSRTPELTDEDIDHIVNSAREKVEAKAAIVPEPMQLHRGVGFKKGDLPPELEAQFDAALAGNIHPEFVNNLLTHMHRDGEGMGGFWSHSKDGPWLAEGFANRLQPGPYENYPADYSVVLTADWDGKGSIYDWDTDPDYRKLAPGTKVNIKGIRVNGRGAKGWVDLGGDPTERYAQRKHAAAFDPALTERLHKEFTDWYATPEASAWFEDHLKNSGWPVEELREIAQTGMDERGPIGYWPNIEGFLKAKYPAAHRNLEMGYEEARVLMDWDKTNPGQGTGNLSSYETGPDAEAQYGYDPKEIVAAMLAMHNSSDSFRMNMDPSIGAADIDRLNEIAQKRYQMQRKFEDRALSDASTALREAQKILAITEGVDYDDTAYWAAAWDDEDDEDDPKPTKKTAAAE